MFPSGKFHLLTAAKKLLKTNQPMKKSIMKPEIAKENSENYENRIPMRLWAEDDLPSQKLLLKGTGTLSDAELLSIIIGSGVSGENSLDIAKKMLSNCGNSLCEFWKFGVSDLQKIKGIGEKRAVKICAMFALARRRNESEVILKDKISRSTDAFEIFKSLMGDLPHEEFWLLLLNKANRVIKESEDLRRWYFRDGCRSKESVQNLPGLFSHLHNPGSQPSFRQYPTQ